MVKTDIAAICLAFVLACAACAQSQARDKSDPAVRASTRGEAQWIRAERDRANTTLLREYIRNRRLSKDADAAGASEQQRCEKKFSRIQAGLAGD